ncbi:ndufb9 [Porites harrisoni]|uniref:NADH dehydrogenase [ubiquinone] 1 beta subcomplex subunit 9-like n=1 Tax=Porites lutea TaxID=51062 RepID=UPI003CC6B91B
MAYIASHLKKGITHQQRVMRLYRNSLKHLLSWCIDRESWREEALILRDRFDKYKNETNQKMIDKVLQDAEIEFENKRHPFPYIDPVSPDGSKWERNLPPPPHVLHMLPWEEEWYKEMCEWAEGKD